MKQTEPQQVGDIIRAMIESSGNVDEFNRHKAVYLWSEVVGPSINKATIRRFMDGTTMHVFISSGVIKSELAFVAPSLVDALNAAVGAKTVEKIVIH